MADILIYLLSMSEVCGIDLEEAVEQKLKINGAKYPISQFKGSDKKSTSAAQREAGGTP